MTKLISEEQVCRELGIETTTLRQWVELGLVDDAGADAGHVFEPDQVRRIWSIHSLQRDLDVNLSGVAIILDLSDRIRELQAGLREAARQLTLSRRQDRYHVRVLERRIGTLEWEVDL